MLYCRGLAKTILRGDLMTVRLLVLSLLVLLALSAVGCTSTTKITNSNTSKPAATATPDAFAASRAVYMKNCKECHGEKGDGGPVKLEDGTKLKVPNLSEGHSLRHPDSDFLKQITKGGDGMPAFKDKLKPEEIDDLIRFIRHEFQGGMTPPAEPANR
jgi:mono/diheme cytochrome c family protein